MHFLVSFIVPVLQNSISSLKSGQVLLLHPWWELPKMSDRIPWQLGTWAFSVGPRTISFMVMNMRRIFPLGLPGAQLMTLTASWQCLVLLWLKSHHLCDPCLQWFDKGHHGIVSVSRIPIWLGCDLCVSMSRRFLFCI